MATDVVAVSKWQGIVAFVRDSYHEIRHKTARWTHDRAARHRASARARAGHSGTLPLMLMTDTRWYAIQTTAGHENKVRSLIQRKIETDARPQPDRPRTVAGQP